jgi:hypothetical protein
MKKFILLVTALFIFTATPAMAEESLFAVKMKNMGMRWTQDTDNLDNFWGSTANQNGLRLFTTAYIGSESHQIGFMYEQNNLGAAWDVFNSRDKINEQIMFEYQYNFDK